jgi:uncharacterized repeat protein (TIGR03803 family)
MQQIRQAVRVSKPNWWKTACAVCVVCAATAIALPAQTFTFTTLLSFDGTDGSAPAAAPVQAVDGNLYGTTYGAGAKRGGTVFKMSPAGTLTTLYSFCSQPDCTDGYAPRAGLVQDTDGDFYGSTINGGANDEGTIFKITSSGTLTTLYSFCSQSGCADGSDTQGTLVRAGDGNFYGTAVENGTNREGTVFKVTPSGTLTVLYTFCSQSGCTDGSLPYGGLVQANDGILYGTTTLGGANDSGTVFQITPQGALATLYSFCSQSGCTDGQQPFATLVQAADGNFYGTTLAGGANMSCDLYGTVGCGTIFKITPSGTLTTLYSFCSQSDCKDGQNPQTGLIQATDGNFYGTTYAGGAVGSGTVFRVTPSGTLTTLHSFDYFKDGAYPLGGLAQDTNGTLYGTTTYGGAYSRSGLGNGTIFSLSMGLGPFVETQPASGPVGAGVRILGTNLTGATSVTFNGTPAVFTMVSNSFITTTVPAGATSGNVQVVTPGGTLSSNVPFRVLP